IVYRDERRPPWDSERTRIFDQHGSCWYAGFERPLSAIKPLFLAPLDIGQAVAVDIEKCPLLGRCVRKRSGIRILIMTDLKHSAGVVERAFSPNRTRHATSQRCWNRTQRPDIDYLWGTVIWAASTIFKCPHRFVCRIEWRLCIRIGKGNP